MLKDFLDKINQQIYEKSVTVDNKNNALQVNMFPHPLFSLTLLEYLAGLKLSTDEDNNATVDAYFEVLNSPNIYQCVKALNSHATDFLA